MKIRLTELKSLQGSIAKKYIIEDSNVTVIAAPNISSGVAKQLEIDMTQVSKYLNSLTNKNEKCIVLGVHGELGVEYKLTVKDQVEAGFIARTQEYFKWANSGNISLLLLDFDLNVAPELRRSFLDLLDSTLSPALIGETATQRSKICKWLRPSTSASVEIDTKTGNGLHVFIPVKGCTNDIIKLIHQFCWLHFYSSIKGYKVTKKGEVQDQSLVDAMVGTSERIVYTSDAIVTGPEDRWKKIARECRYEPGGILDAELATDILIGETLDFTKKWNTFRDSKKNLSEVVEIARQYQKDQIARNIAKGMTPAAAKKAAECSSRGILLSNTQLTRTDETEVYVVEILTDPLSWLGEKHFNDPYSEEKNRNVAMIVGSEFRPKLKSFAHSGVIYDLKWTYEDLDEWITTATNEDTEAWYKYFQTNSEMSELQTDALQKKVSKKLGANIPAIRKDIASVIKDDKLKAKQHAFADDPEQPMYGVNVISSASHGDIMEDYVANSGDCKAFGDSLWVWDSGSIWKEHNGRMIRKTLRTHYNHVVKCQRKGDYDALAKMIVADNDVSVSRWPEVQGFPCSDGFYKVDPDDKENEGLALVPYTKDLGCYFKIGYKPNPRVPMPGFQQIIDNTENPILFQQLFGLALCGHLNKIQMVFVMIGRGGEGKGATARILTAMLPPNRVTSVSIAEMNHEYYKASIANSRINIISETQRSSIDMTGIKQLTGGDLITARQPSGVVFNYYAKCSFILSVNDIFSPEFMGEDIKRRFGHSMVKFRKLSEDEKKDQDKFEDKIIQNELPGILAWAMEGVRMYFRDGKLDDAYSLEMFQRWTVDVDPVANFFDEFVEVTGEKGHRIKRSDLWDKFKTWAEDGKLKGVNKGNFIHQISKNKIIGDAKKDNGVYYFNNCIWAEDYERAIRVKELEKNRKK